MASFLPVLVKLLDILFTVACALAVVAGITAITYAIITQTDLDSAQENVDQREQQHLTTLTNLVSIVGPNWPEAIGGRPQPCRARRVEAFDRRHAHLLSL